MRTLMTIALSLAASLCVAQDTPTITFITPPEGASLNPGGLPTMPADGSYVTAMCMQGLGESRGFVWTPEGATLLQPPEGMEQIFWVQASPDGEGMLGISFGDFGDSGVPEMGFVHFDRGGKGSKLSTPEAQEGSLAFSPILSTGRVLFASWGEGGDTIDPFSDTLPEVRSALFEIDDAQGRMVETRRFPDGVLLTNRARGYLLGGETGEKDEGSVWRALVAKGDEGELEPLPTLGADDEGASVAYDADLACIGEEGQRIIIGSRELGFSGTFRGAGVRSDVIVWKGDDAPMNLTADVPDGTHYQPLASDANATLICMTASAPIDPARGFEGVPAPRSFVWTADLGLLPARDALEKMGFEVPEGDVVVFAVSDDGKTLLGGIPGPGMQNRFFVATR